MERNNLEEACTDLMEQLPVNREDVKGVDE